MRYLKPVFPLLMTSALSAPVLAALRRAACSRLASHSLNQTGGSPTGTTSGWVAANSNSPSACLQGNLRLGQVHLNAG